MISVHKDPKGYPVFGYYVVETPGFNRVSDFVTKHVWSHNIWAGNARGEANWAAAHFAVLDYDKDVTKDEAREMFKDYLYIMGPTKSDGLVKAKTEKSVEQPPCDRFRVILKFMTPIYDLDVFKYNMLVLAQKYRSDTQGCNGQVIWQPCKEIIHTSSTGKLVDVLTDVPLEHTTAYKADKIEKYVQKWKDKNSIPPRVARVLMGNFAPGERNKEVFFAACFLFNYGFSLGQVKKRFLAVEAIRRHEGLDDTLKSAAKRCGVPYT